MKQCNICGLEKELAEFTAIRPKKSGGFTYNSRCKKCHAKLAYEARKRNPDKLAEDVRKHNEWQRQNKDKAKEYQKKHKESGKLQEWREKNKDKRSAINKRFKESGKLEKWKDANPDKLKANSKKFRESGKSREYVRQRREADPNFVKKLNEYCRVRRLRRKEVGGSHTVAEWKALKDQYDHKCLCCGKAEPEVELTRDHIIAITKGGTDDIENIQPLCRGCNAQKQTSQIDFRK
jgi:5-methylcytosine-specific restriction endonuclease McrA